MHYKVSRLHHHKESVANCMASTVKVKKKKQVQWTNDNDLCPCAFVSQLTPHQSVFGYFLSPSKSSSLAGIYITETVTLMKMAQIDSIETDLRGRKLNFSIQQSTDELFLPFYFLGSKMAVTSSGNASMPNNMPRIHRKAIRTASKRFPGKSMPGKLHTVTRVSK